MKFYLSSYKVISQPKRFKSLIPKDNRKTAYISNALDYSKDLARRKKSEQFDRMQLTRVGLKAENIDLRKYFGKSKQLKQKMDQFGVLWVRGGNVFVLRQAMRLSGLDNILRQYAKSKDLLYGGYSAGGCVMAPSLKGLELVDDASQKPYRGQKRIIWRGLNLIKFSIAPHYKSKHFESSAIKRLVKYYIRYKIPHKALQDGEVIIIN
ncbi:MAG: Type 1 glutamine amidotransferase-like domain-containing protein [Patescibacteria group bacterium]